MQVRLPMPDVLQQRIAILHSIAGLSMAAGCTMPPRQPHLLVDW